MTEMRGTRRTQPAGAEGSPVTGERMEEPTAWVGWILFAGTMLILLGSLQMIAGFVGLFQKTYYTVRSNDTLLHISYNSWGGLHIALGALAVIAGFSLMTGHLWARIYAVAIAFISVLSNIAFLAASPVWCTIMIAIDLLVIWAVTVHGREVKSAY